MKLVGPRLGHVIDDGTSVAAELGVVVGHNLQFRNRVLIAKENGWSGNGIVVVTLAIDLKIIGASPQSIHRHFRAIVIAETGVAYGDHARQEHRQGIKRISHRQAGNFFCAEGFRDLVGCGFNQGRGAFHRDRLGRCADRQLHRSQIDVLSHVDEKILRFEDAETRGLNPQVVRSRRQIAQRNHSGRIGLRCEYAVRGDMCDRDRGIRHHRPLRIFYRPRN